MVIPFFDRGLPVEYELTRSIRVVSRSDRKKVGILSTDAKLMGGFDMRSMGQNTQIRPGPFGSEINRPIRKITPRSYSRRTFSELNIQMRKITNTTNNNVN